MRNLGLFPTDRYRTRPLVFLPVPEGTFTATAPLCESGLVRMIRRVLNPSVAHGWTIQEEFTCDDNNGTFVLQFHARVTADPAFTYAGPWSIVEGGTGKYAKSTGHGDFGVVIDREQDPFRGEESFVGFVQLH